MSILIQIAQLLLALTILVFVHEFGHYITAKIFGARVEKFYLFFNPKFSIFKKKIGETVYGIGWVPLGGYVKIAGMIDESMDKEQMKQPAKSWEFRSKPTWQRLIIILAGVFMNIVLAWFIYSMMIFSQGVTYLANKDVTDGILITNPEISALIGLENGDKIISADGSDFDRFFDTYEGVLMASELQIERNGKDTTLTVPVDFINQYKKLGGGLFYMPRMPFVVSEIPDSSHNAKSGLISGDIISAIDQTEVKYYDKVGAVLDTMRGKDVMLRVERDDEIAYLGAKVNKNGELGIYFNPAYNEIVSGKYFHITDKEFGFFASFAEGGVFLGNKIANYWKQLKKIFTPESGAYKSVGSVITMGSMFPKTWNWIAFWELTAFLSIMLAVINVMPIPALDGGHAVIIIYEMISRKQPPQKLLEILQTIGFLLLVALMVLALGNDILRLFK